MKSIYEEAIELIENIDRNLPYTWIVRRDVLMKIKQTLEQAQKQEKLLELYIKIYNGITDYHDYDELSELQQKIKELEND